MPVFTETKTPYELLFRWKDDGTLSGAHVQFREATFKDGVKIAESTTNAQPVATADGQDGLALAPILGQLATDQAKQIDTLTTEIAAKDLIIVSKDDEIALLTAERDAKIAEIAVIRVKLEQTGVALASLTVSLQGGA